MSDSSSIGPSPFVAIHGQGNIRRSQAWCPTQVISIDLSDQAVNSGKCHAYDNTTQVSERIDRGDSSAIWLVA